MEAPLDKKDVRRMALAERHRIADTLDGLNSVQWERQTLCRKWLVCDVAGHLASYAGERLPMFFLGMATCGFDNDQYNLWAASRWSGRPKDEVLAMLRSNRMLALVRAAPHLVMVDNVVHHQDIRRPLGLGADFPEEHLRAALQLATTKSAFASEREHVEGRRLVATDLDWAYGEGPELTGTGEALLLYLMGRDRVYPELDDAAPASSVD